MHCWYLRDTVVEMVGGLAATDDLGMLVLVYGDEFLWCQQKLNGIGSHLFIVVLLIDPF